MFLRKKLSIIMTTLFLLNQKAIADQNTNQNLDIKIISQVIEDYNEKLRPQKKKLVNKILEILDTFPEDYFLKILKTCNDKSFSKFSFLAEAITLLNAIVDKQSDEILEQELKETKIKTFKCILDGVKNSITPDIMSRVNVQIQADFKNEIFSQEDEVYIIAAVGAPLLNIATQLVKLAIYTNLSDTHSIRNLIDFDLEHNALSFKKENTKYCNIILNDDEILTVKILYNNQEVKFQLKN